MYLAMCIRLCPMRHRPIGDLLLVRRPRRAEVVSRLSAGDARYAPAHLDAEVIAALRGLARAKPAVERTVPAALRHLAGFPIRRMPRKIKEAVLGFKIIWTTVGELKGSDFEALRRFSRPRGYAVGAVTSVNRRDR